MKLIKVFLILIKDFNEKLGKKFRLIGLILRNLRLF